MTIILTMLLAAAIFYRLFNPAEFIYFPKCPFLTITGYKCPGCGSQRAIHYLLNFNFIEAFRSNALVIIAIPYLITGFVFDRIKNPNAVFLKWRRILFGAKAIYVILTVIISFWILRNVPFHKEKDAAIPNSEEICIL